MWPEDSEGHRIEEGLIVLYDFFGLYLEDADRRVNSCNNSVQDVLVEG